MKPFKFWTMTLALMLGFVMTSCDVSNDDDDDSYTQSVIALYQSDGTFVQDNGLILVPTSSSKYYLTATDPGMYEFTIEYNPYGVSDNRLEVTLLSIPESVENNNIVYSDVQQGNINLYDLNYYDQVYPSLFNEDYIMVPVIYWCENSASTEAAAVEFAKHTFTLTYTLEPAEEGVLELYLIDNVSETDTDRTKMTYDIEAFNLSSVIAGFKAVNGTLNTIRISAYVCDNSCSPDDTYTKLESFDIDYDY